MPPPRICGTCKKRPPKKLSAKPKCRECAAYVKARRQVNADRCRQWLEKNRGYNAKRREAYAADSAPAKARARAYYRANRKLVIERTLERNALLRKVAPHVISEYMRTHAKRHPHRKRARGARDRAKRMNATPPWADYEAIENVYALANLMTRLLGKPYHVDHAVPLAHRRVCGLHVHANLQVISGEENLKKGNRSWPGMR